MVEYHDCMDFTPIEICTKSGKTLGQQVAGVRDVEDDLEHVFGEGVEEAEREGRRDDRGPFRRGGAKAQGAQGTDAGKARFLRDSASLRGDDR